SSDVCSSDLERSITAHRAVGWARSDGLFRWPVGGSETGPEWASALAIYADARWVADPGVRDRPCGFGGIADCRAATAWPWRNGSGQSCFRAIFSVARRP